MTQRKIVTAITSLAMMGAIGAIAAAPAAASDATTVHAPTAVTATLIQSWGPYQDIGRINNALHQCNETGQAGVRADKWKNYRCTVTNAPLNSQYVNLYVG